MSSMESYFNERYILKVADPKFKTWESKVFPLKQGLWKIVVHAHETTLGIYLEFVSEQGKVNNWSCNINGLFRLKKHTCDSGPSYKQPEFFTFKYSSVENNTTKFGYEKFIQLQELYDPSHGWLKNGKVLLEVSLIADFDKTQLCQTNYNGLENPSSICYMNSSLQVIFHTNAIRRAVFQIPNDTCDDMMIYCLQRIFFELQFNTGSVSINDFTYLCMGVSPNIQQDSTETLRQLLTKINEYLMSTSNNGLFSDLFKGHMTSSIICQNIDYTSSQDTPFYDLQLNINGLKDIYASLDKMILFELLDNDNKYYTSEYGFQTAYKGIGFTVFPPILHMHLNRFEYNRQKQCSIKYNDRFEFFASINLDKYVARSQSFGDYILQAVLVHSGSMNSGHYVVFINPKADGHWFKFDDNFVCECTEKEAIEENFGGYVNAKGRSTNKSAYMLVYMRKSELDRILMDIPENEIPLNLITHIKLEEGINSIRKDQICKGKLIKSIKCNVSVPLEYTCNDTIVEDINKANPTEFDSDNAKTLNGGNAMSNTFKFQMFWTTYDLKLKRDISLTMDVNSNVEMLLKMALNNIRLFTNADITLRLLKIVNNEIYDICKDDTLLKSLICPIALTDSQNSVLPSYRVEIIPDDQKYLTAFEMLLPVFHFNENIYDTFGEPFLIKLRVGETLSSVKKSIQRRLNISNEEWKMTIFLVVKDKYEVVKYTSKITRFALKFGFDDNKLLASFGLKHLPEEVLNQN